MERFAIKIDKKLKQNLYKICRLCGIDNPDMVPILTDKTEENKEIENIDVDGELEMSQKISLLIGLTITKDDKMPQTMCCLCVDKINDFYEFREMCYATNAQTRKLLGLKNVKKPVVDIKPKVEVKEESIVPTPVATSSGNKNANRKRKSEELQWKEEALYIPPGALPKKKLRFSAPTESAVKEEVSLIMKKKLRFTAMNEDFIPSAAGSSKKSKNYVLEESKLKKELSPPPVVSNKKFRLAAAAAAASTLPLQKELPSNKKTKQKGGKTGDVDVKEEIKEEIYEDPAALKLKFGCNICKERFAAKTNLDVHTRTTHLPKVERFVCTACNEVLSKSFDIKNHQLWHKLSKTPYVCGCCGESILNTYAFSRHLREHGFETPPALLVLDRECPQCHISYATNYLYNIHICAVRTKRCAGCNRLQRNEAEYLKHSALCAKVYLNYSKHIMPSVEALEDAVRIKNENDVEAAAEEMARISGLPLDMAPVVQLTRLSSPIIMAANQCVSMTGLDDSASSSSKKSGKKGVSKKDLKRVDELLKSTLDALVSIKHEPEVHVEPETPCAGVQSDNDEDHEGAGADASGLDDFHHNDDDTDDEEAGPIDTSSLNASKGMEQIKIKQEIDEANEENSNKIGGGLKLKIKKEHGQLNSSIIEQQKSSEKRAEKRKKKKKHKDKEKDKQKLTRDMQDEQLSQDSPAHNSEENAGTPMIRIKAEPQDDHETGNIPVASSVQIRPQPEATIMTSIPMMQFQIACVSSGVEFNNGGTGAITETQTLAGSTINHETEPEDVKPNREELDRLMKISHVSSGIAMETDETTVETENQQPMEYDGSEVGEEQEEDDYHDGEDHHYDNEDNESEQQDDNQSNELNEEQDENEADENNKDQNEINTAEIIAKKLKKPILKPKSKQTSNDKQKPATTTIAKSRNKACKSTAKPSNMPVLQISAVCSGVSLEPTTPTASEFTPIFIKPEPQNRGYSDEQPVENLEEILRATAQSADDTEELVQTHTAEEQNYIASIDFNNITIKQEKDIEISDVQITPKTIKTFANVNGIKRKRKQRRTHVVKYKTDEDVNHEKLEDRDENMDDEEADDGTDEEIEEENEEEVEEEEEDEEVDEEEEEEDEEELDEEEEEEREYRELEYPPELIDKNTEIDDNKQEPTTKDDHNNPANQEEETKQIASQASSTAIVATTNEKSSFLIASVCSQAALSISDNLQQPKGDLDEAKLFSDNEEVSDNFLTSSNISDAVNANFYANTDAGGINKSQTSALETISANTVTEQAIHDTHLNADPNTSHNTNPQEGATLLNLNTAIETNVTKSDNNISFSTALPSETLQENKQFNKLSLKLGQTFELKSKALNEGQEIRTIDASIESSQNIHNHECTQEQLCRGRSAQEEFKENVEDKFKQEFSVQQNFIQNSIQNNQESNGTNTADNAQIYQLNRLTAQKGEQQQQFLENSSHHTLSKTKNTNDLGNQTSKDLQTVFNISSITSTAALDIKPEFNSYPISNNQEQEELNDNQVEETATIEGVIEEAKELNLEAQPFTDTTQNTDGQEIVRHENEDDNEDEYDEEEADDENSSQVNNLEERQNYQNQEVLAQIRPAALALHPYLEDISSSSNSLLSNSLSQTPPLAAASAQSGPALAPTDQLIETQRLLNTEETENILNETNDHLNRRSSEVAVTSTAAPPLLAQQLPPHMPTFNFDNINEIAENNNNANIEREQLQDEQQHQQRQQHQQPTTNTQ
ncbi:uncharacterized protein ACRADG_013201 [Cochliomyia hominivorax]